MIGEGQEDFSALTKKEKESLFSCVMYCPLAALAYVLILALQIQFFLFRAPETVKYVQWIDPIASPYASLLHQLPL